MNELAASTPASTDIRALRMLVHAIAISLLILLGTVFVFLYREVVVLRKQTVGMSAVIADYERSNVAEIIDQAGTRLAEFARQNPDFQPIYSRYFGTNNPAAAGNVIPTPAQSGDANPAP